MKMIGDEVYLQRGEIWSLDFEVTDKKGHPIAILKNWKNPYIVITVAAALYEQKGDMRESYWLDLDKMWAEQEDGNIIEKPLKRFTSAEVLPIDAIIPGEGDTNMGFCIQNAMATYGPKNGGNIVLDKTSDFDVTNFLFYIDPLHDGNYIYAYVDYYETDNGNISDEVWKEYDFRIVKRFTTRDWTEQRYLYDVKIVSGESVQERLIDILARQGVTIVYTDWTEADWETYLDMISDETLKNEMRQLYEEGVPLMPGVDTESIILYPTSIYVSVNLQEG